MSKDQEKKQTAKVTVDLKGKTLEDFNYVKDLLIRQTPWLEPDRADVIRFALHCAGEVPEKVGTSKAIDITEGEELLP